MDATEVLFWLDVLKIVAPLLAIGIAIWKCGGWVSSLTKILEKVEHSVTTIEKAITRVDLKSMERELNILFGRSSPSTLGNTVQTVLTETQIGVSISLVSKSSISEIEIRFDQPVEVEGLYQSLLLDKDLKKYEIDTFGRETGVAVYSPRGLSFNIHSDDIDLIATWTKFVLDRIDNHLAEFVDYGTMFDKSLEEKL